MKKSIAIIALFSLGSLCAQAQQTATWKGGTAGRKSDWNCPSNWKEGRVPNEFSHVVIPDISSSTFCYPIIDQGEVEVQSLLCSPTAHLTVRSKARLIVLEPATYGEQIRNQHMAGFGRAATIGN
ncbi:MAG: hypothetical protein ACKVUS_03405 [Saprospiraceae bacterium]